MYTNKKVLIQIFQGLQKLKNKIILQNLNVKDLLFFDFLWTNKIIYGYTRFFVNKLNQYIVFLKYNKITSTPTSFFVGENFKYIVLKKEKNWAKNTFFIISTKIGFLNSKDIGIKKIGGFLIGKLF